MKRGPLFYWILFAGGLCLMVSVWIHRNSDKSVPEGFNRGDEHTSESRQRGSERANRQQAEAGSASMSEHTRGSHDVSSWENDGGNSTRARPPIPGDKGERIQALYDNLTEADWEGLNRWGPHPKEFEILTEGMDAFSAAKYLRALGYEEAAREYADRAVAENPDSFDALWLKTQLLPYGAAAAEIEAGYRQLLEWDPTNPEVLLGLGEILTRSNEPGELAEAIGHLQRVIKIQPSQSHTHRAYMAMGASYNKQANEYMQQGDHKSRLVQLERSLAFYKKAHQTSPYWFSEAMVQIVEEDIELAKGHQPKEQSPEFLPPEEALPEWPLQGDSLPAPSKEPRGETGFDYELPSEPPGSVNGDTTAAEQREIEEFLRMLEEIEQTIPGESSSPLTPTQRVEE